MLRRTDGFFVFLPFYLAASLAPLVLCLPEFF